MSGDLRSTRARAYLLGELSPAEAEAFEASLLDDDEAFDLLELAESDVLDALARGELSQAQRLGVEAQIGARHELAERVAFARALAERADRPRAAPARPSAWVRLRRRLWPEHLGGRGLILAAAALALVLGSLTLFPPGPRAPAVAQLSPDALRDRGAPRPVHLGDALSLRLSLLLDPDDAGSDLEVLVQRGGKAVWRAPRIAPAGHAVVVELPTFLLEAGRYEITVSALPPGATAQPIAYYTLDLTR
jgi:hypothetical protein